MYSTGPIPYAGNNLSQRSCRHRIDTKRIGRKCDHWSSFVAIVPVLHRRVSKIDTHVIGLVGLLRVQKVWRL
jgi:hypothetical protein